MSDALCTICIPAFQAAPFIARTLDCAQAQSERAIAIHVSVDQSDDETADICEARAALDPRIRVSRQGQRVGWSDNTNCLIRDVQTPFFFLYFHDDLIADTYVERLCGLLRSRPDAATAHGDMKHFGATEHVAAGAAYEGGSFERQFQFLEGKHQPPLLRAMTRTNARRRMDIFVPSSRAGANGAHHVYVLGLLAAGASLHAPEVLYQRHNMRSGGLTESWRQMSFAQVRDAFEDNAEAVMNLRMGDGVRELQRLVAYLFVMTRMRLAEQEREIVDPIPAAAVSPHFVDFSPLRALKGAEAGLLKRALSAYARLLYVEGDQCERRRDFGGALDRMAASAIADAGEGRARGRIDHLQRKVARPASALERAVADGVLRRQEAERLAILLESEFAS